MLISKSFNHRKKMQINIKTKTKERKKSHVQFLGASLRKEGLFWGHKTRSRWRKKGK
jgi:hypothetical protein